MYILIGNIPILTDYAAANGYELNNLDNEVLDAPVYNTMCNNPNLSNHPYQNEINNDFTSLPCDTFLISTRVNDNCTTDEDDQFSYKNPMYQSAHVQAKSKPIVNDEEIYHVENTEEGTQILIPFLFSIEFNACVLISFFFMHLFQFLHHS